jgi:hypothetical protein
MKKENKTMIASKQNLQRKLIITLTLNPIT